MQLEVVTPEGIAAAAETDEIVAPGGRGEIGILPGHIAMVTTIRPGLLRWRPKGQKSFTGQMAVDSGVMEVSQSGHVTLLVRRALAQSDAEAATIRAQVEETERLLATGGLANPETAVERQEWDRACSTLIAN